jgi:hypothetical protein
LCGDDLVLVGRGGRNIRVQVFALFIKRGLQYVYIDVTSPLDPTRTQTYTFTVVGLAHPDYSRLKSVRALPASTA